MRRSRSADRGDRDRKGGVFYSPPMKTLSLIAAATLWACSKPMPTEVVSTPVVTSAQVAPEVAAPAPAAATPEVAAPAPAASTPDVPPAAPDVAAAPEVAAAEPTPAPDDYAYAAEIATVIAVPLAGELTPVACFVERPLTAGWDRLVSAPRWNQGASCTEWLVPGADLLTPKGVITKYGSKVPEESFVVVGSTLARFVPKMLAVQSIASAPDDPAAEAAVRSIIKSGTYAGQPIEITFAKKYAIDLNGDGTADRLYLASGFATDGKRRQADGGVYWADGRDTTKVVPVSTALSNATLLGVLDLDRDGQRELLLMHETPTGRSYVVAGLTHDGWSEHGEASIDPHESVGVHTHPLPVAPAITPLVLDPAIQVLGLGRDMPLAAVKAAFGEPFDTTDKTLVYLDGGLVVTVGDGRVTAVRIERAAADHARLRGLDPWWSVLLALDAKTLAKAVEGTKRPFGQAWDHAPKKASVGVSLVIEPCPRDETSCAVTVGWWKPRAIGLDSSFYGMTIGADPTASMKAITTPSVSTEDGYIWADGALKVKLAGDTGTLVGLRARYTPTPVIVTKASPGPFAALGGDIAKASKLLGPPDRASEFSAVWSVPSPAVEAFRVTFLCAKGICSEALVLIQRPGAGAP